MNRSHPAPSGERRFRLVRGGGPRKLEEPDRLDRFLTTADPLLLASLQKEEGQRRRRLGRRLAIGLGLAIVVSSSGLSGALWLKRVSPNEAKARILVEQGRKIMSSREMVFEGGRYSEALDNFELAVKLAPDNADAWTELGSCRLYNYQSKLAEEAFQQALALEPENLRARHGLGNLYLRRGEEGKAEEIWRQGGLDQQLARLYLLQGRFREAEARLAPLLADSEDEMLHRMAQAARSRHLEPSLRTLLEPEPTGRSSWADLGWRLSREKRFREATKAFRQAIGTVPSDVNALSGLGWALLGLHRPAEARRYFQQALWWDNDHMLSLNGMAHSFKDEGRIGEAIAAWNGMAELYPDVNDGTPGLAWTYYEMRDYHQAALHFARLIKRYPYDSQVIEALNVAVENIDAPGYD